MGNVVEALIAGMGLLAGVMVFLTSLWTEQDSWRDEESTSHNHPRTIHPDGERKAA
jgi:hypothetical protein